MSDKNHFTVTRSGEMDADREEQWLRKRELLVEKTTREFGRAKLNWSPTECEDENKERLNHLAHANAGLKAVLAKAEAERAARVAAGLEDA